MADKINIGKAKLDAEKGIFYWGYYNKWQEFKKELSQEDRIKWDELTDRVHRKENGQRFLEPPLTHEEQAWARDIMRKAKEWGLS